MIFTPTEFMRTTLMINVLHNIVMVKIHVRELLLMLTTKMEDTMELKLLLTAVAVNHTATWFMLMTCLVKEGVS